MTALPEIESRFDVLAKLGEGGMGCVYKVRHRDLDEPVKIVNTSCNRTACFQSLCGLNVPRDAAGQEAAAHQPMAEQARVQAQQVFAEPQRVCVDDGKSGVIANRANVRDMVVKPFQFEQDHSKIGSPARNFGAGEGFHRLAKRQSMGHARITGNSFGQLDCLGKRC